MFWPKVVVKRKGFNTVWNQMNQKDSSTFEPVKVIQEELILEMLLSIVYCKTMYCHWWNSPSMFITSGTDMNWDQQCVTVWYLEDSALKQADMLYSSPWWIRLRFYQTRSNAVVLYETHCLQSSLRKRCAWKLENSFNKEKAKDHVLRSKQIRNVNHKIYQVK